MTPIVVPARKVVIQITVIVTGASPDAHFNRGLQAPFEPMISHLVHRPHLARTGGAARRGQGASAPPLPLWMTALRRRRLREIATFLDSGGVTAGSTRGLWLAAMPILHPPTLTRRLGRATPSRPKSCASVTKRCRTAALASCGQGARRKSAERLPRRSPQCELAYHGLRFASLSRLRLICRRHHRPTPPLRPTHPVPAVRVRRKAERNTATLGCATPSCPRGQRSQPTDAGH